ncbi:pilus assembly protein TadG-related protein [Kocuria himachalensis]
MTAHLLGDERGGVSVMVALLLVVLLGAAAIAVDAGAMYAERAELQNGADAAALAIAQECAKPAGCVDAAGTAALYADENAKDNASNVADLTFPTAYSVRVQLSSRDASTGAGTLALFFAPVLGIDDTTVGARAGARWGAPLSGPATLPIAISPCEFTEDGQWHLLRMREPGSASACAGPAGQNVPGGFGWIGNGNDATCTEIVTAGNTIASDPGGNVAGGCEQVLEDLKTNPNKIMLLPVYDQVTGTGSGATYRIRAWAAFEVGGWHLSPSVRYKNTASTTTTGLTCTPSCTGIIGRFLTYTTLEDGFEAGGSSEYGASFASLTE